jgi:endoglucanase
MYIWKNERVDSPFNEKVFQTISEWGFNFVRFPMDYRILFGGNDWNNIDEKAVERLDQGIEYGNENNIHVCINLHRAPGYHVNSKEATDLWTENEPQEAFTRLWGFFAERYKKIPNAQISFNLVNEPPDIAEEVYASVMKKAADAIRAKDPNRLIIADGREYGNKPSAKIRELGIMQSMRGYYPFTVSHYKAEWVKGASDYSPPVWPLSSDVSGRDCLRENVLKPWEDYIACNNVMVGEWGAHNKTPHDIVLRWMEDSLMIFKEYGLGWALWNFDGSFGVVDSGRADVQYEDINGFKVDRKMLELLQKYLVH